MGKQVIASEQLKYGWVRGGKVSHPAPIGASEVFKDRGGAFVKNDASGRAEVAVAGTTAIWGYLEVEEITVSAVEGAETRNLIVDPSGVFRIPINTGTYVATMLGKTCDLSVATSIQGAALDLSSEDTVRIVGGDVVTQFWVELMMIDAKRYNTGVV